MHEKNAEALYTNSFNMTRLNTRRADPVKLSQPLFTNISPDERTTHDASYDAQWMRFTHAALHDQLSPHEYTTALGVRCNVIASGLYNGEIFRCSCDTIISDSSELIDHAMSCSQLSKIHNGQRHTWLKAALANIFRSYGGSVTNEPNFYPYPETDIDHRPDLTFYTLGTPIVTDVTIVTPAKGERRGVAASRAAEAKSKHHTAACAAVDHRFIPFAMETTGHFDIKCFALFNSLVSLVPHRDRFVFRRDMMGAASTALARFRAHAILNACKCISSVNV